ARDRDEVPRSVQPIMVYTPAALDTARAQIGRLRDAMMRAASSAPPQARGVAVQRAAAALRVPLTAGEADYLVAPGHADATTDAVRQAIDRWLAAGVAPAGALDSMLGAVTVKREAGPRSLLG